jgi:hypothetical protein
MVAVCWFAGGTIYLYVQFTPDLNVSYVGELTNPTVFPENEFY